MNNGLPQDQRPAFDEERTRIASPRYDKKLIPPRGGRGLSSFRFLEESMMWSRLFGLVLIGVSVVALRAQPRTASDIHPESLSRLPPVQREALDANGQRVYDVIASFSKIDR